MGRTPNSQSAGGMRYKHGGLPVAKKSTGSVQSAAFTHRQPATTPILPSDPDPESSDSEEVETFGTQVGPANKGRKQKAPRRRTADGTSNVSVPLPSHARKQHRREKM